MPILIQNGASVLIKDKERQTPLETACSDHIRELLIIYSNPQHDPSKDDLDTLALTGDKLKIEKIMTDKFGKSSNQMMRSQPMGNKTMKKIHPDHL